MANTVKMRFPGNTGVAETTRQAFELVWQPKGWVLVEAPTEQPTEDPAVEESSPVAEEGNPESTSPEPTYKRRQSRKED